MGGQKASREWNQTADLSAAVSLTTGRSFFRIPSKPIPFFTTIRTWNRKKILFFVERGAK